MLEDSSELNMGDLSRPVSTEEMRHILKACRCFSLRVEHQMGQFWQKWMVGCRRLAFLQCTATLSAAIPEVIILI